MIMNKRAWIIRLVLGLLSLILFIACDPSTNATIPVQQNNITPAIQNRGTMTMEACVASANALLPPGMRGVTSPTMNAQALGMMPPDMQATVIVIMKMPPEARATVIAQTIARCANPTPGISSTTSTP